MTLAIFKSKPVYNCSHHQNRYLLAEEYSENSYFLPISFILPESIDVKLLQSSISAVVASEDSINVFFEKVSEITFGYKKATKIPLSVLKETHHYGITEAQLISDFIYDETGPLTGINCKVHFLKSLQGHTICTIALHHAVADALSLGFFMDRISSLYTNEIRESSSEETFTSLVRRLKLSSNTWSINQQSFWIETLSNASSKTASLPLNIQQSTENNSKSRNTVSMELTKAQLDFIRTAAKQIGVTTFEYVFSSYLFALKKYTTGDAICATFQSSGRRNLPIPDKLIGVFSNALPIFSEPKLDQPFNEFALEIRRKVRAALEHEALPYHEIIRLSNFHPQFGINWYPVKEKLTLNNHVIDREHIVEWQSDFLLNLHCLATDNGLSLRLSYPAAKVTTEHSSTILEQIQYLLLNTKQVDSTDFYLLQDINLPTFDTSSPSSNKISEIKQDSFYAAFVSIAEQLPKQNAVITDVDCWQYSDLLKLIDDMAEYLKERGISAQSKVALRMERGLSLIIYIFALNKLKAIFSIYDTDYPSQRLTQMDVVFAPEWAICSKSMIGKKNQLLPPLKSDAKSLSLVNYEKPVSNNVPESARYALFTSGTTGNPKCVLSSEKGLLNFIFSQIDQHSFGPGSHFALTSGLGHDPILRDLLTPLLSGGSLAIPPNTFRDNPRLFAQWLLESRINVLHFTPQMSKLIVLGCRDMSLPDLKFLFWGGDLLKARDINNFLAIAPNVKAWNIYGATETPQASSIYPITPPFLWETCPIGMAVDSRTVEIINNDRQVGLYEIGEIVVSGPDLSLGYYDANKGLTPLSSITDDTAVYSTGDLGYITQSGISIIGRLDNQLKVRGNRIEPKEITSLLESQLTIEQAVISTKIGSGNETELIVYVEKKAQFDLNKTSLFNLLKQRLPAYMIPHDIIILDSIPMTPNGKIDHNELAAYASLHQPEGIYTAPETKLEKLVCEEISTLLSRPKISTSSTVRELGVDSLSFLTVSMSLEKILGTLPSNWDELSLRELARVKAKRSILKPVESPILMRALAIMAVVAGHFGILSFGGATSALFFIAGHSFGRFQVPAISSLNTITPVLKIMALVALPTLIWTLTVQIAFGPLTPASWIFITNLIDPHLAQGMSAWFIEVLLQCLAVLALIFSLPKARQLLRQYPYETAFYFTLVAYVLNGIFSQLWDTSYLYNRVPQEKIWLMGLGWCLVSSITTRQLQTTVLLTIGIFGIEWFHYGTPQPITLATFLIVLSMQRVLIPFPLNRIISLIASASLMIYLTQFQFKSIATKLPLPDSFQNSYVYLIFALLGGIVIYRSWELFLKKSRDFLQVYTK